MATGDTSGCLLREIAYARAGDKGNTNNVVVIPFDEDDFDLEDLNFRTHELADFVSHAAAEYGFDLGMVAAAGYSNGANIASSLLLLRPEVLSGAVLLRAGVAQPAPDERLHALTVAAGQDDRPSFSKSVRGGHILL